MRISIMIHNNKNKSVVSHVIKTIQILCWYTVKVPIFVGFNFHGLRKLPWLWVLQLVLSNNDNIDILYFVGFDISCF